MGFLTQEKENDEKPKDVVNEFLNHEFKNIKNSEKISSEKTESEKFDPERKDQLEKLKEKFLSNIGSQTELEQNPIIGEGGISVINPGLQIPLQPLEYIDKGAEQGTTQDLKDNLVKGRIQEMEGKKKLDGLEKDVQDTKDELDEEIERLVPEINLPSEAKQVEAEVTQIPTAITQETGKPEVVISKKTLKRELGEKIPFTKTRGWHLKKNYVDSNGDVYHFGKFSPGEKGQPEEPKKA
jgi:polyhydroxyalkanoate synthesis regulator phasin